MMQCIIPFGIMIIVDFMLVKHIYESKKLMHQNQTTLKELRFTIGVVFINGSFMLFNFPLTFELILDEVFNYINPPSWSTLQHTQFTLYACVSIILSHCFQAFEFGINMAFNRGFRKEIVTAMKLMKKENFKPTTVFSSIEV